MQLLRIEISQNKPSKLLDHDVVYTIPVSDICYGKNSYTQIGKGDTHNCLYGYNLYFMPTGLSYVPFIEVKGGIFKQSNIDEVEMFINRIRNFLNDDSRTEYSEALCMDKIHAIQTLKLTKIKEDK